MTLLIREQNFGIEIEMTGITREKAASVLADYFGTAAEYVGGVYNKYRVKDSKRRYWNLVRDSSIKTYENKKGKLTAASTDFSVELVSPICEYGDIELIQELIRRLRKAGAVTNESTGIHIHVDASKFDAVSLRNLTNIIRSKEDILYKVLQVDIAREHYCKKVEERFLAQLNKRKPKTKEALKNIWYQGIDGSSEHYHSSRYHALNLHSVFQKGTVEFRMFNSTLHAGKVKTYIQLSLAICSQALTQKKASYERTVSANEKYTFRTWLLRLGMIGDEFKTARKHLLEHLDGNIAWKDPSQIEKQKQRFLERKLEADRLFQAEEITEQNETEEQDFGGMSQ